MDNTYNNKDLKEMSTQELAELMRKGFEKLENGQQETNERLNTIEITNNQRFTTLATNIEANRRDMQTNFDNMRDDQSEMKKELDDALSVLPDMQRRINLIGEWITRFPS